MCKTNQKNRIKKVKFNMSVICIHSMNNDSIRFLFLFFFVFYIFFCESMFCLVHITFGTMQPIRYVNEITKTFKIWHSTRIDTIPASIPAKSQRHSYIYIFANSCMDKQKRNEADLWAVCPGLVFEWPKMKSSEDFKCRR